MFINHWHVFPDNAIDRAQVPYVLGDGSLAEMADIMKSAGVARAVAFAPGISCMPRDTWYKIKFKTARECNEWLFQALKGYENITGFANVNPRDPDCCDVLNDYFEKGFKGVKLHPPCCRIRTNDPRYDQYYRTIERAGFPVSVHTGIHGWQTEHYLPILMGDVAGKFPDLKLILEHVGGNDYFDQALAVMVKNKNCYAGITQNSGRCARYFLSDEKIKLLLDKIGVDRIIYGLDYPWNSGRQGLLDDIRWISGWGLSQDEQEKVLGGNLAKLVDF
ncbi:MAG: amidohydrolase family protein [Kiritimatiellae bacterium]|nr:amidohydrolase family protein [Kiritimatiellia bacterium]